jgi:hypothetical protein
VEGTSDVYTLRNYGRAVNCSLATLFPARLRVLSLSVGSAPGGPPNSIHQAAPGLGAIKRNIEVETGTIHKVRTSLELALGRSDNSDDSEISNEFSRSRLSIR